MISNAAEDLGDSKAAYISIQQAGTKSMKKHKLTLLKPKLIYFNIIQFVAHGKKLSIIKKNQ
jgi:hypothetical protein